MKIEINKNGKKQYYSLVDKDDYENILQFNWTYHPSGYAYRNKTVGGKIKRVYMHRAILNPPGDLQTDHINGDKLDNRKINLRIVTQSQNSMNSKPRKKYKGAFYDKESRKWHSYIWKDYKKIEIGYFETEQESALAYNKMARIIFGEYAKLNEVSQ